MNKLTFVLDIDNTICKTNLIGGTRDYSTSIPFPDIIWRINKFYDQGHRIILFTARNVRTYNNDIELIKKYTKPILIKWLSDNNIKYHELIFGKPWGENVVYVDDKAMTTNQFLSLDYIDSAETVRESNQYINNNNRILNLTNGLKDI